MSCCGICRRIKPRWRRLVDNIYPVNAQDGLIKSNVLKLITYSRLSPEKLDRIGAYIESRIGIDLYRKRIGFVILSVDAMNQLIVACTSQQLGLLTGSYLRMVQRLLESDRQMQLMATDSFDKFSNIPEDMPSYHRRYDFFVAKFAAMCHSCDKDTDLQCRLRAAGVKGLQGVIRKTVNDDLAENIWTDLHMEKIIPSLLYNMQLNCVEMNNTERREITSVDSDCAEKEKDICHASELAKLCFRDLIGRASHSHINAFMKPMLKHMDNHELWTPNFCSMEIFTIIRDAVPSQHLYVIVQVLMNHLEKSGNRSACIKTGIIEVLSSIITIAAGQCIGPSVLEVINSLLLRLEDSVSITKDLESELTEDAQAEVIYQEALINTLGVFSNNLPDYQKIEVMMFIMSKVAHCEEDSTNLNYSDATKLRYMLLKSLLKVGTRYVTVNYFTTFPLTFLDPLIRVAVSKDCESRLIVQNIIHTLIDRHDNTYKLSLRIDLDTLCLSVHAATRQDIAFMRRNGPDLMLCLLECLEPANNTLEMFTAVFCSISLLWLEINSREILLDVLRCILDIQDLALNSTEMSSLHKIYLHITAISLFSLVSRTCEFTCLREYVDKVIANRRRHAIHLLPPVSVDTADCHFTKIDQEFLIQLHCITGAIEPYISDLSRIHTPFTSTIPRNVTAWQRRHSMIQSSNINLSIDLDNLDSSIVYNDKDTSSGECIDVGTLRRIAHGENVVLKHGETSDVIQRVAVNKKMKERDVKLSSMSNKGVMSNMLENILGNMDAVSLSETDILSPIHLPQQFVC